MVSSVPIIFCAKMNAQRAAIIEVHLSGKTPSQILKAFSGQGTNRFFIHRAIKRYQQTHSIQDRERSGRPTSATAPEMVKKVALRIQRNPRRPMRKMAREMHISEGSMRTIVKKHLHLKSLKRKHAQLLPPRTRHLRLQRSKALLRRFTADDVDKIPFSSEK